jgi:uncharacterized protein involved in response to NO
VTSSCKRSNRAARRSASGYLGLVAAGEPFRLLFPLGTALGLLGVLLWPAHVWGNWIPYPGALHARIMIEGFLSCFVFGFLGTAFPRLIGAPRLKLAETMAFGGLLGAGALLGLAGFPVAADEVFLLALLAFVGALAMRGLVRTDLPPPAFVLVAGGFACALAGVTLRILSTLVPEAFAAWVPRFAALLLHQGYLLLPIMGVGAFLLPRFFGLPNRQQFPESLVPPPGWARSAAFAGACGLAVIASFGLEAAGWMRGAFALRALGVAVFLAREVPIHRARVAAGTLAAALRVALLAVPAGYLLMVLWPGRNAAFIHVVFITGFSLITLTVASRVVLGHSGQAALFDRPLKPIYAMLGLVLLAMATRVSADWLPAIRLTHLAYAAVVWALGVAVWASFVLPGVGRGDAVREFARNQRAQPDSAAGRLVATRGLG